MTTLHDDVNNRISELENDFISMCDMIPSYTKAQWLESLRSSLKDYNAKAREYMRSNAGGHLDDDTLRIEILAIKQITG